jgi:hypothetical protein
MGDRGGETPTTEPEFTQGAAPAGKSLGASLPTVAVPGGKPYTLNGYTASGGQDALPAPGSREGEQSAPSGVRR